MQRSLLIFISLWVISFSAVSVGNETKVLGSIPSLQGNIEVDGILDEAQWSQALEVFLEFEVQPGENIASMVATRALLFEDKTNLYVAFEASDANPELIRAYLSDRDNLDSSDIVSIKLDTFNDSRKAFQFSVNPLGVQSDSIIDAQTSNSDLSWDAIWYSAGLITSTGYNVEIKIPLRALRFQDSYTDKKWGVEFNRIWNREVEHRFSNQPVDRNVACSLCQMQKIVGFKNVESPTNITVIPSLTMLSSQTRSPLTRWSDNSIDTRASLDLRWGITQDTFVNATINPDFSQVEADSVQLDINNLSSLFLSEKRPFFQDGADYFSNWSRLVYSRIFEEPEYGIKVTGKEAKHSYGYIGLEDKHTHLLFPYEYGTQLLKLRDKPSHNNIFRYRYDLGESGNLGATITSRQGEGYHNTMLSFDGKIWFGVSDSIRFQLMSSESEYPVEVLDYSYLEQSDLEISDSAFSINYSHEDRDWKWSTTYHQLGKDFRADAGYISFANWKRLALEGGRNWYSDEPEKWWKKLNIYTSWISSKDMDNFDLDTTSNLNFELDAIYESTFGVDLSTGKQFYFTNEFNIQKQAVWGEFSPLANLSVNFEYEQGDGIDYDNIELGFVKTLIFGFDWQISQKLKTDWEYINQRLDVNSNKIYEIGLSNASLAYQYNENSFIRFTIQSQNLTFGDTESQNKRLASQLLYSYKINPYTLFYLGYSDRYRNEADNRDLEKTAKSIFIKFSYAWQS